MGKQQNKSKNNPTKENNNNNKHEQQKNVLSRLGFEAVRLFLKHATSNVNVTRFDVLVEMLSVTSFI